MPHRDPNSEEVVNQWLARYEDELVRLLILPDEFLIRERLDEICSKSQFQSIKNGLTLAYDDYLRSEQTIIADIPGEPGTEEDLSSVQRIFENSFKIEKLLGRGGFGSVYLAKEMAESNRFVAIKVLDHVMGQERFLREIHLTSLISHPNLIPIFNSGESNGKLYYCMPYFRALPEEGPFQNCVTLNDVLKQQSNLELPMQQVASMMRDVARGLKTLHDIKPQDANNSDSQQPGQVIHRDIKPGNILLTRTEDRVSCVLSDFGLAKIIDCSDDLTVTKQFMGSWWYAPPEQIHNSKSTDIRSDIYSVGATFYKFVTNRIPSNQPSYPNVIEWHKKELEPIAAREFNTKVDIRFEAIIRKCIRCRPEDRYQSSHELLIDLENYLDEKDVNAPILRPWQRTADRFNRNRRKIFQSPLVTFLLMIAVVASYFVYQFKTIPPDEIIIPVLPQQNVAELFRDVNLALDQGDVAKAVANFDLIPEKADGWLKSYLQARIIELPQIDKIVADHDWGVTDLLIGDSGLISAGLDQRLQYTAHDSTNNFDISSGKWIQKPGKWQPAFNSFEPFQFLPDSECIVDVDWVKKNSVLVGACWSGRAVQWSQLDDGVFESTELFTHSQPLTAVASQESVHLFGDQLGQLIIINSEQQIIRNFLNGSPITCIVLIDNGSWLVGQANGMLTLLDKKCERILDSLQLPSQIFDVQRSPSGAIAVAAGSKITILDIESRIQARHIFFGLPASALTRNTEFHAVCFDHKEDVLVAGDSAGRLIAWNLTDGTIICHEFSLRPGYNASFSDQLPIALSRRVTAIRRIPNENAFYVTGWNGLVQTWHFKQRQSATTIDSMECIDGCFLDDDQLMVLNANGILLAFDTITGGLLRQQVIPVTTPQGLFCLNESTIFVWDDDGAVFEVSLDSDHHVSKTEVLFQSDHKIQTLVSNPKGDCIYFYDHKGSVGLWHRNREAAVTWYQQPDAHIPQQLVLAYSPQLDQLAVSGSGQSIRILEGSSLAIIRSIDLAAGDGCTHLTWTGVKGDILYAGDTEGSIRAVNFSGDLLPGTGLHKMSTPLRKIVSSDDGKKVYVVTTTGIIQCLDATTGQSFCDIRIPETGSTFQLCTSVIDPTGQHIALLASNGRSVILHGIKPIPREQPTRKTVWTHQTLWSDSEIDWIRSRQEAVRLTNLDHLALLYSTRAKAATSESLWIAREKEKQFFVHRIARTDLIGLRDHRDYSRSMSIQLDGSSIIGVYRQYFTKEQGYNGGLNGIQWNDVDHVPKTWFENVVTGNLGFENHLTTNGQGQHQVLTFDHTYRGLLLIDLQTASIQQIGRQGDGLYFHSNSSNGQTDVVSSPSRYNSEPSRVWHHQIVSSSNRVTSKRRVIDQHCGSRPLSILIHDDEILTLIRRPDQQRQIRYILLRGNDDNWTEQSIPIPPFSMKTSNLCLTPDGRCLIAYIDQNKNLTLCAVDSSGDIKLELISESPLQKPFRASTPQCLVLRLMNGGHPVICLFADGPNGSSISTYQQNGE